MMLVLYMQKVLALAKPCVEEGFTKLEPAALESVTKYVDAYRECQSKVGTEGTETEQEAKVQLCLKDGPARSEEHGKAVSSFRGESILFTSRIKCMFMTFNRNSVRVNF